MKVFKAATLVVALSFALASAAGANIGFTGSSGTLAASANFSYDSGSNVLTVVLSNTSAADVLNPAQVLTALFFDITGFPPATLTPMSAMLTPGSTVFFGADGGGNVGGEFAYGSSLAGAPGAAMLGTSSSGFGLFGGGNFNGPNLQGPNAVDGVQYGLTSAGDNLANGNAAVTGGNALIKNSVTLQLFSSADFSETAIHNVWFQYGTSLDETRIPSTPEPTTMLLLGLGLAGSGGMGVIRRRRSK